MPAEIPGADKVVFGLVAGENGFRIMGYDIPASTVGGIAGGGATRRENNTTITDQALFVSISSPTLDELRAAGMPWRWMPRSSRPRGVGVERRVRNADRPVRRDVESLGRRRVTCAVAAGTCIASRPPADLWMPNPPATSSKTSAAPSSSIFRFSRMTTRDEAVTAADENIADLVPPVSREFST